MGALLSGAVSSAQFANVNSWISSIVVSDMSTKERRLQLSKA